LLGIPSDYRIGIVPASDTGAFEMALWSLIGPRAVTALVFDAFGQEWADDLERLVPSNLDIRRSPYGTLPTLQDIPSHADLVFPWNGTTSGVMIPHDHWLAAHREGLVLCDATSAVFMLDIPWQKLDVVTWSWQKALGGEAGFGMIALSPRAVERLAGQEARPLPKIFRLAKGHRLAEGIFAGETINTPSMLAVEDHLDALAWAEEIGGLTALHRRCRANAACLDDWVGRTPWIRYLAESEAIRSPVSVCLVLEDKELAAPMTALLAQAGAAYDIESYRDAPKGLRIWCGPTVEGSDIAALLPWLDWAHLTARASRA
jgi:phosphoserine aminotransferase